MAEEKAISLEDVLSIAEKADRFEGDLKFIFRELKGYVGEDICLKIIPRNRNSKDLLTQVQLELYYFQDSKWNIIANYWIEEGLVSPRVSNLYSKWQENLRQKQMMLKQNAISRVNQILGRME
jgi:hypothetical protein